MKIEDTTIEFKSTPDKFYTERSGLKSNTIRRISMWSELKEFEAFYQRYLHNKTIVHQELYRIRIINTLTREEFTRTITDITQFEDLFVFSWMDEE